MSRRSQETSTSAKKSQKKGNSAPSTEKKKEKTKTQEEIVKEKQQSRMKSPIYKEDYVNMHIKPSSNPLSENWTCSLCPGSDFTFKYLRKHLKAKKH